MSSKNTEKEQFGPLLQIEESAVDMYKHYIERIKDPFLLSRLKELHSDEQKHVAIVKTFMKTIC